MEHINGFYIIGAYVRTSNQDGKSMYDIPALWNKFMSDVTINAIPNKIDDRIYCVYTEYESDHLHPYTTVLGCKVSTLDEVPEELKGIVIRGGNFKKYIAEGDPQKGSVYNKWLEIWNSDLVRAYNADYEIYDESSLKGTLSSINIFISVP